MHHLYFSNLPIIIKISRFLLFSGYPNELNTRYDVLTPRVGPSGATRMLDCGKILVFVLGTYLFRIINLKNAPDS